MADQPTIEEIFDAVENRRDRIAQLLCNLIQIPTVVPPGDNYEDFVDFVEPIFKKLGCHTERVVIPDKLVKQIPLPLCGPRVNLVATKDYGQKEDVTIYAHMDVVSIDEKWSMDPFEGIIKDNKVYGRGACDMKSGIASMIVALEILDELKLTPHFNIICTLCTDEEIGLYPGIYHLAKEGYVKGHLINTELGGQVPLIIAAAAGDVDFVIRTKGRSAHSGMNFLGINAIEEMVPILNELLKLKVEVEQRESTVDSVPLFKSLGAPSDKMTPMFNLDIIHGGSKANIVPSECEVLLNRRYIPEEDLDEVTREVHEAVERGKAKSKALDVVVEEMRNYPAFQTKLDSPHLKKMAEALKVVHGYRDEDILFAGISGSTDMGFVEKVLEDIDIIGLGAISFDAITAHAADEYVNISALVNMTKQLVHYLVL
ncbi:MAG: M20 family metallopeptidase [Candidatus Thorarchaeota archaeon]